MCAGPRANHILRNLPPSEVSQFAQNHDTSLRACLAEILAVPVPTGVVAEVAHLPFREGGLGLRSAMRLSPAAYWASWADCLSQVHARAPQVCTQFLQELEGPPSRAQCVREAQDAAALLAAEGMEVPDWSRFKVPEFRAPQPVNPDVGEWIHGWQFHASVARDTLFATRVHLPPLSTDHQALRASQRGPCASRHFTCLPTSQETRFTSEEFRTLMLVRLHLPLHVDERVCKCGQPVDVFGHHRSACSRIGLLKPRGTPAEVCMARICREAGARVKENQLLRDLNVIVPADDQRRIEVIANGPSILGRQAGCHRHHSGFSVDRAGHGEGSEARPGHPRGGTGQVPQISRVGQREPVPFARDGIRGGRAVERHSRHLFAKSGLVQVPVSPKCFAPFHAVALFPTLDCFVGLLHPTGICGDPLGQTIGSVLLREWA